MGSVTVAAVIPLYNGAPFIREALESVIRQTVPADEIIVVDDGSTDDGLGVARAVAAEHPRAPIRFAEKPNGGQSSARNLGVALASSSHVAFLDQDDVWYPDHLAILREPFETAGPRGLGLAYGNLDRIDRSGRMVMRAMLDALPQRHPKTSLAALLRDDLYIVPAASLVSVAVFRALGGFDERLIGYEDDDLFLRLFCAGHEMVFVDRAVTRWRVHASSTTHSPVMARSRMIYWEKLRATFPDDPVVGERWVSELIAPRFFRIAFQELRDAARQGRPEIARRAFADMMRIGPHLRRHRRRRFNAVAPLARALLASGRDRLAYALIKAVRPV